MQLNIPGVHATECTHMWTPFWINNVTLQTHISSPMSAVSTAFIYTEWIRNRDPNSQSPNGKLGLTCSVAIHVGIGFRNSIARLLMMCFSAKLQVCVGVGREEAVERGRPASVYSGYFSSALPAKGRMQFLAFLLNVKTSVKKSMASRTPPSVAPKMIHLVSQFELSTVKMTAS